MENQNLTKNQKAPFFTKTTSSPDSPWAQQSDQLLLNTGVRNLNEKDQRTKTKRQ